MKKLVALALAMALAVSVTSCGPKKVEDTPAPAPSTPAAASQPAAPSEAPADDAFLGVSIFDYTNSFVGYIRNGMDFYMNEKYPGLEYLVVDGENNQATQTERIDTMINRGVDVLLVNPVDSSAGDTIIQKAKDANLPIVFFNRQPALEVLNTYDKCWYVGLNSVYEASLQADMVNDAWVKDQAKWDVNGDGKLSYVLLKGVPGHMDTEDRANGFKNRIAELGTPVELMAEESANWSAATAKDVMETWIGKYGDQIELVVCGNDAMALGAVEALKGNGLITDSSIVPVVGINALPEVAQLIKDGVMLGSVLTSTYSTAKACIDMAMNAAAGRDILDGLDYELEDGKIIRIPETVITVDNVDLALEDYKASSAK